jgi:beta-phosphoglucomutase-like phosphatase (HAD superfamily)
VVDTVIFDLDGVIVDSEPAWERVRRRYVGEHGGRWQPDTQGRLMGMSTGEWARYLSEELGVDATPDQVANAVVEAMVAEYALHVPLIASDDRVVRRLAARWPIGLASSSPPALIDAALSAAGLTDVVAVALSSEQVARGKPAPDVYLAVAKLLNLDAARCVAVEDSSNGIRSAAAAGMLVVAVPAERYPLDPDAQGRVTLVLSTIEDLTDDVVESLA